MKTEKEIREMLERRKIAYNWIFCRSRYAKDEKLEGWIEALEWVLGD